jgi:hypothetical protein
MLFGSMVLRSNAAKRFKKADNAMANDLETPTSLTENLPRFLKGYRLRLMHISSAYSHDISLLVRKLYCQILGLSLGGDTKWVSAGLLRAPQRYC